MNAPIDDTDTTLLHLAANTMPATLELLLQHQADVNQRNEDGIAPLHVAAMWGNSGTVRMLLEYGADPLITDDEDMTPLDHAIGQGKETLIKGGMSKFGTGGYGTVGCPQYSASYPWERGTVGCPQYSAS